MIVFMQKLSTREICRRLNISRQARLDILLQCDAPEVAGVLHYSMKNEKKKIQAKISSEGLNILEMIFFLQRSGCSRPMKYSNKGGAQDLRMMSRECGVVLYFPATRHGIRYSFLHTYHTVLCVRIALRQRYRYRRTL